MSRTPGAADEEACGSQESFPNSSRRFRPVLNSLLRILRNWSPDFCASAQPFQVCVLLGPYAANLQATFAAPSPSRGEIERALIRSTIARIAEYWSVGGSVLGTFIPAVIKWSTLADLEQTLWMILQLTSSRMGLSMDRSVVTYAFWYQSISCRAPGHV
jgi:hypothetical protein